MTIHTCWSRTAIAAAATALFFGGPAAGAAAAPAQTVPVQSCPGLDVLARPLLAAGFPAQAAKNYASLTHRDCIDEI